MRAILRLAKLALRELVLKVGYDEVAVVVPLAGLLLLYKGDLACTLCHLVQPAASTESTWVVCRAVSGVQMGGANASPVQWKREQLTAVQQSEGRWLAT